MALEARVVKEYRWRSIVAFDGVELVKDAFNRVPAGREKEAKRMKAEGLIEVRKMDDEPKIEITAHISDQSGPTPASADAPKAKKKAPSKKTKTLVKMMEGKVEKVVATLEKSKSIELLQAAFEHEAGKKKPRVTVVRAINARIRELESGGE